MLRLLTLFIALTLEAAALSPPVGWSSAGMDRAVLDAADPTRGEILEVRLAAGTGDPRELVTALGERSIAIDRFGTDPDGAINLVLGDRLGRARYRRGGEGITWWVVLVGQNHARNLDPDALIKAVAPTPEQMSWGQKEAAPGGADGSPWGATRAAPATSDGWISEIAVTAWAQDPVVVGTWEASARLRGISTRIWFRFENTGLLQIERRDKNGKQVDEGKWATRGGLMQLDIAKGGANVPYMSTGRTLSITYAGASITLYRQ
jgi:hypothetical protein